MPFALSDGVFLACFYAVRPERRREAPESKGLLPVNPPVATARNFSCTLPKTCCRRQQPL